MSLPANWQYIAAHLSQVCARGQAHLLNCLNALCQADLPYDCCLCREPEPSGSLCESCYRLLPLNVQRCGACAIPHLTEMSVSTLCTACTSAPPPYRRATVPLIYAFPADYMISQFKYAGDVAMGRVLGEILGDALVADLARSSDSPEIIVPVPQSPEKLSKRGFNQAAELSRFVSIATGLPVVGGLLIRSNARQYTSGSHQRQRSRSARLKLNQQGFDCTQKLAQRVLLIDDVMTTGTTLSAATRALHDAGVKVVDVAAVARTPFG